MNPLKIKPIKSVMSTFPFFVEVDDPIRKANEIMRENNIRHLPVEENSKLVGILSDRDLKWFMGYASSKGIGSEDDIKVSEVYRKDAYKVDINERLDNVLEKMAELHVGSVLVVKDDKLAGIFTTTDACRCFAEYIREDVNPTSSGGMDLA